MKSERLDFLADNPHYTKRFAFYVGRRCRSTPIRDIAAELKLNWHSVKELDKQYMRAQLEKAGTPAPVVIGIDEISVGEGHDYRIVVSDHGPSGSAAPIARKPACPNFINGLANGNARASGSP